MSLNFLHLNPDKTEIILFGPDKCVTAVDQFIGPLRNYIKPTAKNLGIIFDQHMTFDLHVTKLVQSCFLQLRNVAKIKRFLSSSDLEQLIHSFIFSRLDHCNSLYTCLSQAVLNRLQLVQNAAARLLTRTSRRSNITPVLASLHWLPVKFRINYKIWHFMTLPPVTFQSSLFLIPLLESIIFPTPTPRPLRSSNLGLLSVPRSTCKSKGDRAFAVLAPTLWNSLPHSLRLTEFLDSFKRLLKTHLYREAFL
ncbi:hypothetical protein N1851_023185 [Merluccius polli]|uniref:Reverse transcriptase domain-containing protein n=1 Tax=Merluccius polli TaxID=89951 RepID=A0AA47MH02_MERPO|nr:hypothetical protein N1851_023185 [Merluccius polli]